MTTERTANQERAATIDPRVARIARVLGAAALQAQPRKESPLAATMRKAIPKREKGQRPEPSGAGFSEVRIGDAALRTGRFLGQAIRDIPSSPQVRGTLRALELGFRPFDVATEAFWSALGHEPPGLRGGFRDGELVEPLEPLPPGASLRDRLGRMIERVERRPAAERILPFAAFQGPAAVERLTLPAQAAAARAVTAQAVRGIPAATKAAVLTAARGPAAQAVVPVKQAVTAGRKRIAGYSGRIPQGAEELADAIDELTIEIQVLKETPSARAPKFGTTERGEYEAARRAKSEAGIPSVSNSELRARKQAQLAAYNRALDELLAVAPEPEQIGAIQKGMGIGEKPAQGGLFEGLQGEAQKLPLADAENLAAQQARRQALAAGQAELPVAAKPARTAKEIDEALGRFEATRPGDVPKPAIETEAQYVSRRIKEQKADAQSIGFALDETKQRATLRQEYRAAASVAKAPSTAVPARLPRVPRMSDEVRPLYEKVVAQLPEDMRADLDNVMRIRVGESAEGIGSRTVMLRGTNVEIELGRGSPTIEGDLLHELVVARLIKRPELIEGPSSIFQVDDTAKAIIRRLKAGQPLGAPSTAVPARGGATEAAAPKAAEAAEVTEGVAAAWETGAPRLFAFDPNSTVNQGRFRLLPPVSEKGRYITRQSTTPGVSYIVDIKANATQSVRFDKGKFTEVQASQWWEANKARLQPAAAQGLPPPAAAAPTRAGPSVGQQAAPAPSLAAVPGGAQPPILPPTTGAAGGAAPLVPPSGLLPDLSSVDDIVGVATAQTVSRRMAQRIKAVPGAKQALNFISPSAAPSDAVEIFFDARNKLRFEGANKSATAFATLRRLGGQDAVFGPLDNKGLLTQGNLAGKALNDIRTNPGKFSLTAAQREWVDAADDLERAKLEFLKRNGIEINELSFAEGGQYAGRRVYARVMPDGEVVDAAFIAAGPGRPGAKLGLERQRIFQTEAEAIEAGYRFLREDEALALNLRGAYNRVADKQVADWLLTKVPWRTTGSPEEFVLAAEAAQKKVQDLAFAQQALNRAIRGERLPTQTVDKVKRLLPEFDAGADAAELKKLRRLIKPDLEAARFERQKASNIRARMRERAVRPQFATEGYIQAPAFAGKIFRAEDAMKINLGLSRRESEVLAALNSVNAIGRFFALAGDASPFTIQLIFLAGRPKLMARAALGFVKAFGSTDYPANMIARKRDIINRNPGFILASSGTEFTEFAHRGLLANGPLAVAGKPLKPFARAFETALDEAGIGLLEALEPMVKTAADREGLNAFVNQFRGLISTSRLGVSPLQRQAESLAMLAPQYNRGIAALLGSTFKGDLQGNLARRGLARGIAAISALSVAYSLARGESLEEAARHLMPNSPDFLTWEVFGQRVGPGSKVRSVLKLLGDSAESIEQGRGDQLIELSMDNPGLRFVRGNLSPIARTLNDLLQGRDYIGDPTRDGMFSISKTVLAENLLPIWTQTVLFEGGSLRSRATRGVAEFFGLRAYPNSAFNDFAKYAESKAGKRYEEMSKLEKDRLKKGDARGRTLWQKYLQDQQARGRDEEVVTLLKTYRSDRIKDLEEVANYSRQSGDFVKLREAIGESGQDYAAKAQAMRQIPRYAETLKRFDEMPKDAQPVDIAYHDYMSVITDPTMDDPVEGYNFAEVDRRLQALRTETGESLWKDVLELRDLDRKDFPSEVQQYYKDQETLEPYWTAMQTALAKYPKMLAVWEQWKAMPKGAARDNFKMMNGDIITTLTSLEGKLRTDMRKKDAKLDAILVKWYGYTPQNDRNVLQRLRERAEALR